MQRREFLAGSLLAAAAPAPGGDKKRPAPSWYELRRYHLRTGQTKVAGDYVAEALIPALQRLHIGPVGAFETTVGPEMPMLHLLIPHDSPAALAAVPAQLAKDPAYQKAAAPYFAATATQPAYLRIESSLLVAFDHMPRLEAPGTKPRIFELRTYESPSEAAQLRKIEMFSTMGEIGIFRRAGLTPVFFARTVVGPSQPGFTYMLTFPDMAAREKAWAAFRADPEWQKLKTTPGYTDPEIVSNITDVLLRPTAASQI
jgi:hypothetical protein